MDGNSLGHLAMLSLLLLSITTVLYVMHYALVDKLETITLIVLQFTAFAYLYSIYAKVRLKWAQLLLAAVVLVFSATILDRLLDFNSTSFENLLDIFWMLAYILFISAFMQFLGEVFLCCCPGKLVIAGLVGAAFVLISYHILFEFTDQVFSLGNPKIIYFVYSLMSTFLFTISFYAYLGSKSNLIKDALINNTVSLFSLAALSLAIYCILDGYLKLNNLFWSNRWVYSLYMLFYAFSILALMRIKRVVSQNGVSTT